MWPYEFIVLLLGKGGQPSVTSKNKNNKNGNQDIRKFYAEIGSQTDKFSLRGKVKGKVSSNFEFQVLSNMSTKTNLVGLK